MSPEKRVPDKHPLRPVKAMVDAAKRCFAAVVGQARDAGLLSTEHFAVDGTLIEAWASLRSFRSKDEEPGDQPPPDDKRNPTVNCRGEKRSNATHASTTAPEAKLARKGDQMAAKLSYSAHALMENRNGLLVNSASTRPTGRRGGPWRPRCCTRTSILDGPPSERTGATTRGTSSPTAD